MNKINIYPMNKIKKFNDFDNINEMLELEKHFYYIKDFNNLTQKDFSEVHASDRKVYYIDNEFEIIEMSIYDRQKLSIAKQSVNSFLSALLFMSEETKKSLVAPIKNIGDLYKHQMEETRLRLKQMLGYIQKEESKK